MKLIAPRVKPMPIDATGSIVDLRAVNQQKVLTVTNPVNAAGYLAMKQKKQPPAWDSDASVRVIQPAPSCDCAPTMRLQKMPSGPMSVPTLFTKWVG